MAYTGAEESAVVLKQILKTSCTHRSGSLNGDNSVFYFKIEVGITFFYLSYYKLFLYIFHL